MSCVRYLPPFFRRQIDFDILCMFCAKPYLALSYRVHTNSFVSILNLHEARNRNKILQLMLLDKITMQEPLPSPHNFFCSFRVLLNAAVQASTHIFSFRVPCTAQPEISRRHRERDGDRKPFLHIRMPRAPAATVVFCILK